MQGFRQRKSVRISQHSRSLKPDKLERPITSLGLAATAEADTEPRVEGTTDVDTGQEARTVGKSDIDGLVAAGDLSGGNG